MALYRPGDIAIRGTEPPRRSSRDPARAHGRYDGRGKNTRLPPGGDLGRPPKSSRNAETVVGAIIDPMGDGEQRIFATINARVDLLEDERAHRLIGEAAYRTGREIQRVLERGTTIGGANWAGASRKDPAEVRDTRAQRLIDDGREAKALKTRIRDRLGEVGTRLLLRILGEGKSYADCAALVGRAGPRGEMYIKSRFREALEDLAEAWAARGKGARDDSEAARRSARAAAGLDERQDANLRDSPTLRATLERLKGEKAELIKGRGRTRDIAGLAERIATIDTRIVTSTAPDREASD